MFRGAKFRRRRMVVGILVVALVAFGISVAQGFASSGKTVKVEKHVDPTVQCGAKTGAGVIGSAKISRSNGVVTVVWKVYRATPGSNYYLYLYDANSCSYVDGYMGKFKVDSSGRGSKVGTTDASTYSDDVYACDYNNTTGKYDCSYAVHL